METNTIKQLYTIVNICTKHGVWFLAMIATKNKGRGD